MVGGRIPLGAEDMIKKDEHEGYMYWGTWSVLYVVAILLNFIISDLTSFLITSVIMLVAGFAITVYWFKYKTPSSSMYDEKLLSITKKKFFRFLYSNTGKSFSEKDLIRIIESSVIHPYFKKYIRRNGKRILNEILSNNNIIKSQESGEIYYSHIF
jgi:hypothetical protein